MKTFPLSFLLCLITINSLAYNFDKYFLNNTLRVDYNFTGNSDSTYASLSELSMLPQWAGRRHNLSKLRLDGNGQVIVSDLESGKCIYKESFSTLFQEWQTTTEAKKQTRSFENTFLIPYPKNKIKIDLSIRNKEGQYDQIYTHIIDPNDILIRKKGVNPPPPHTILHRGGETNRCINVAILAEGYTAGQMKLFRQHAQTACDEILSHTPFNKLKTRFNFYAIETPSKESGISVPRLNLWKETAFSSHFDTFYSDRYLTTTHIKDIHDAIAGIPYAHIIILANTDVYGGGGIFNSYTLTTTGHPDFKTVVVHEFGHSFAGLADEYFYESDALDQTYTTDIEPWEPNITPLVSFDSKWRNLLKPNTPIPTPENLSLQYPIGVYEGGGYLTKGMYRPAIDCRMKTNTCKDFCLVCQNAIEQLVKFYTE